MTALCERDSGPPANCAAARERLAVPATNPDAETQRGRTPTFTDESGEGIV